MKNLIKIILLFVILGCYAFISLNLVYLNDSINKTISWRARLDRLKPNLSYLSQLNTQTTIPNKIELARHIKFYEFLYNKNPKEPFISELLGFCYFHIGKIEQAKKFYLHAIQINPISFTSFYNLGIITLSEHHFAEAKTYFQKAATVPTQESIEHLLSSPFYRMLMSNNNITNQDILASIPLNYKKNQRYIDVLSVIELEHDSQLEITKKRLISDLILSARLIIF